MPLATEVSSLAKKVKMTAKGKNGSTGGLVLVEFKAPKELVAMFDARSRSHFSTRSEAIRTLMRRFLDETAQDFVRI